MISVVIPLYNKQNTIGHTLRTVMDQTYTDFEVIIVNDGSTDNSVQIIRENFSDKRIHIIQQFNSGVSIARNTGIKVAKGEWIAFLDADDEWLPEYLEEAVKSIETHSNINLILSGRYSQNILTRERVSTVPPKYTGKVSEINFFDNPHVFAHISATIINAKFLKDNADSFGLFVPGQKSNEDFTFLYRLALHTRCLYIGKALAIYNGGVEGQVTSKIKRQKIIRDNVLMRNLVVTEWYKTNCRNKTFRTFMKYETRHNILNYLKNKKYTEINTLISGMDENCKRFYNMKLENILYSIPSLNILAIFYIYTTKIIWRTHGYPRIR